MTNKQLKLRDKVSMLIPLEGRVLISANKVRTYKTTGLTSSPVDPNVSEDEIVQGETEMILEEIEQEANYRYQSGVVLQKTEDEDRFEVGDTILYELGALQEFDYVKGVSTIRKYDVAMVVKAA